MLAEYLLFINLMFGECRGEPILGQYYTSQVILTRPQEDWLDKKQFSCISNNLLYSVKKIKKINTLSNKYTHKLFNSVYDSVNLKTICFWTVLYINADLIRMLNTKDVYHFMTIEAHNKMKKTSVWYKTKTEKLFTIGNHVFSKRVVKKEVK